MIRIERTNGNNKVFEQLCRLLDHNLDELVGNELQKNQYEPYNSIEEISMALLLYVGKQAVGCAALKKMDSNTAKVKRVYVCKDYRGQGLSKQLMRELEAWAKEQGFRHLVLETGKPLETALNLYTSIGFQKMGNYGPYREITTSVCMEKYL